jgi:membrane-associated phospholipid phosphatase
MFPRQYLRVKQFRPLRYRKWKPYGRAPKSWWPDALLFTGFLLNTIFLLWPSPVVQFDTFIRESAYEYKIEWLRQVSLFITNLGSGRAVAPVVVILAVLCAIRSKSIRPFLMFTAGFAGLGVIFILKNIFGRPLSHHPFLLKESAPDGAVLFDYLGRATAYPSGHATNTIVFYGLVVLLVGGAMSPRLRRLVLIAPPILVVVFQIYAGYHWLSDAPAGFMLGALIVRMVRRVDWTTIPLGPLQRFEPAPPRLVVEGAVLITAVGLCATLPQEVGPYVAAVVLAIMAVWACFQFKKYGNKS